MVMSATTEKIVADRIRWIVSAVAWSPRLTGYRSFLRRVMQSGEKRLQPLVGYLPDGAGLEIRYLRDLEYSVALLAAIYLNSGKLVERHIAVLVLGETNDNAEHYRVVALPASFKHKPSGISDGEYSHAYGFLALSVLGVEGEALEGFLQSWCHQSVHIQSNSISSSYNSMVAPLLTSIMSR